jgi:hypothetical protein
MAAKKELTTYANKLAIYDKLVAANLPLNEKAILCLILH